VEVKTHGSSNYTVLGPEHPALLSPGGGRGNFKYFWVALDDRMDAKEVTAAKLAEWNLTLSDAEIEQLLPAYENLLRWQSVLEGMLRSRKIPEWSRCVW
jgi:hypothetical protein